MFRSLLSQADRNSSLATRSGGSDIFTGVGSNFSTNDLYFSSDQYEVFLSKLMISMASRHTEHAQIVVAVGLFGRSVKKQSYSY